MDGPVTSYLYLGLRSGVDWWETLNESKVWQDRFFYGLAGAYALIATIALVQLIRIEIRVPEYGWTTQKVFHLLNFLVNGVRAVVFVFRQQVQFLKPEILQALLLDLPGLLFLTTYTLLVRFWAEIYHQARSLPTDKLRPTFIGANIVIYVIQIFIWLNFLSSVSKIFFAGVSFAAAIGFLLYGGRLFLELQRFPIESKGRHKKLREVGWVTAICFTCFIIRSAIMAWAAFDKRLDLDVLDHPVLNAAVYFLVELAPSALVLYILRKLPPKRALPTSYQHIRRMSGNEGDNLGAGGSNNPPSITDFDEVNKVLKQLKQETFTTGEDADAWLKGIEFYFEVKKTPELLKATIADQLLSGPAKIWWDEYKKDNLLVLRQISWDTFKDAFKLHYVPACFKLEQMNKFQNLVQEDTVEGYANKFRALQPYGPTMTVAQLVDKFIRGLKPELTMLVGGVTYPSLEEAIRVFKFKEQVQDRIKHDREEAAKHWKLARENLSKQRERDFVAPGGPGGNVRPIPARKTNAPSQMSQEERERCRREDPEQDATCSSSPIQPQPRKTKRSTEILLILDFNRVLGKVYDLKERIPASAEPEVTLQKLNHQKTAVLRPGLQEFLEWCFSEFEIALWSSMAKSNVDLLMRKLLQEYKGRFLFIWNQDDCTNTKLKLVNKPIFLKDLSKVYQKYWKYQVKNTLLIDDSRYKGSANQPNTMICPNSFAPDRLDSNFLLEQLKPWLEGLLAAESVPAYVKENQMWNMWDSEESRNCMKILDKYFHK